MKAADALRAQAEALRLQADVLESLAGTLAPEGDELLDLVAIKARCNVGRGALTGAAARGELRVSRGPRGKLLVRRSELDAWLASKPYTPPKATEPAADIAAWERSVRRSA